MSFHSLEDRTVKEVFKEKAQGCTCPKDFPVCVCGRKPEIRILTKSAKTASDEETESNPRSRSAKLRICEKIEEEEK
ncbi:MAG: 16S rRNA (cytosine(1402)-N(4))-methyltransferase, partial [Eubacteriaceae bacterium]|nr:16S rRNA (cytosine(1402)-N(4))-methyltransferase [Eubacteriaceae bacterium]